MYTAGSTAIVTAIGAPMKIISSNAPIRIASSTAAIIEGATTKQKLV
jgi:hypothetical protein